MSSFNEDSSMFVTAFDDCITEVITFVNTSNMYNDNKSKGLYYCGPSVKFECMKYEWGLGQTLSLVTTSV